MSKLKKALGKTEKILLLNLRGRDRYTVEIIDGSINRGELEAVKKLVKRGVMIQKKVDQASSTVQISTAFGRLGGSKRSTSLIFLYEVFRDKVDELLRQEKLIGEK